jgi:hypothetical protein
MNCAADACLLIAIELSEKVAFSLTCLAGRKDPLGDAEVPSDSRIFLTMYPTVYAPSVLKRVRSSPIAERVADSLPQQICFEFLIRLAHAHLT